MNKKLIAIAVASVMAAPVAMADLKISGRVNQQFINTDVDGGASTLDNTENGHTRLQFDASSGNAYGRVALDERFGRDRNSGTSTTEDGRTKRDQYVGYKFGSSSLQYGRMGGAAKNVEKDPLIATFLEVRSSVASANPASAYDSSSFVNEVLQFKTKAGGATVNVQLGLSDNDVAAPAVAGDASQGYTAFSVTGKAGPVAYFVSWNNDAADSTGAGTSNDDSNLKIGATMKFGKVNTTVAYKNNDNNGFATDSIVVRANMGLGDGMKVYGGIALRSDDSAGSAGDATWLRLAVSKEVAKGATFYGGYTQTDYDNAGPADVSVLGVGMTLKF